MTVSGSTERVEGWRNSRSYPAAEPFLSVITPAYNRAAYLPRLVGSLEAQTDRGFEWIAVDDGSRDGTREYLDSVLEQDVFPLSFISVRNGGKPRAVNHGVSRARGRLVLILDSDDYLTPDAVERIRTEAMSLERPELYAGLCFRRGRHPDALPMGKPFPKDRTDWKGPLSNLEFDKAEVFFTDGLKRYPFPEIEGETFVPEAVVWDGLSRAFPVRLVDHPIYICEYLDDGLTRNFLKSLRSNPRGFGLYYSQVLRGADYPIQRRIKALVRLAQIAMLGTGK